ncbi:MAG: hypothetical protein JW730_13170 [Anaerolineales bacterium]|nr:hypothetical protein [Anaerolineales bacterium]
MNRKIQAGTLTGICVTLLLLLACGQITPGTTGVTDTPTHTPTHTPTFTPIPITITPTSTPGVTVLRASDDITPPPPESYTRGEIEMHNHDILGGGEDCVSRIPFTINWETDPPTIKGEGNVDCHFQTTGSPKHHAVMKHTVKLEGKFATGDLDEQRLLITLTFNGSLSQYDTEVPEGAVNFIPESKPFVMPEQGSYPDLNFEFLDGAKVLLLVGKGEKIFFLRLME